jgi:tripartite-type tricarboxylate transporter receptor subunit TctC
VYSKNKKYKEDREMIYNRFLNMSRFTAVLLVFTLACFTVSVPAQAADYPQKGKVIQMMIGFAPGTATDVGARIMASGLEKELEATVLPVNKPGASSQIMYTALSQSKPDGYIIGTLTFPSTIVSSVDPTRKATYSRKSFELLALHVVDPGLIAVKADSPYKSLKQLIEAAKAKPKTITISTSGIQSDEHFALLQLQKLTGAYFSFVHFSTGGASALPPVLGGKVDVYCGNVGDLRALYKSGEMRILGVMDEERSEFYPEVKTFEEQGYKLYNNASRGFAAPAGTPKEIVNLLSNAIKKVVATPEHKKRMADMGLTLRYMDPVQYDKYWKEYEAMVRELLPLTKE